MEALAAEDRLDLPRDSLVRIAGLFFGAQIRAAV